MKVDRTTRVEKTERVVVEEKEVGEWNLTLSDEEVALITLMLGNTYTDETTSDLVYNLYTGLLNNMSGVIKQPFKFSPYVTTGLYQPKAEKIVRA